MKSEVVLEGVGLHSGKRGRVCLRRHPGAVSIQAAGKVLPLMEARVVGTTRATTLRVGRSVVSTVEHLLAACGGLGIHEGLLLSIEGPEIPVVDGGAAVFCEAVRSLGLFATQPRLAVRRDGELRVGHSVYAFSAERRSFAARVRIDFDDDRVTKEASWDGQASTFEAEIAPARTFAFATDLLTLAAAGLASHVTPESAVVLTPTAIHAAGRPFDAREPARHKLLDLVGDLFLYGGPPHGAVDAFRPGHTATHEAVRVAMAQGILVPG